MSIFVKAINLYKKYGYDVKTGLNPMHFCGKAPLYFPFTYIFEKGSINELITGGGYCAGRSLYDRKFIKCL